MERVTGVDHLGEPPQNLKERRLQINPQVQVGRRDVV
jgi:hypothetical protein